MCTCVYMHVCMREYVYVLHVGMCLHVPMSMCMYVYEYVCMCIHPALLYPGSLFEFKGNRRSSPRPFQAIPEKNLLVILGSPLHRKL